MMILFPDFIDRQALARPNVPPAPCSMDWHDTIDVTYPIQPKE
jgi:hypothetical protein